jgi:hypothetical protein
VAWLVLDAKTELGSLPLEGVVSAFGVGAVLPNPKNGVVVVAGLAEANGFVGGAGCCVWADGANGLATGSSLACCAPKAPPPNDPKGDAKSNTS